MATAGGSDQASADPAPPVAGEAPALTVAAVARRLGVAPATLRTWDRRYGLGPSAHSAGSHRRYTKDDVARLLVMRGLTLDGVAPSEAARVALEADVRAEPDGVSAHTGPRPVRLPAAGDGAAHVTPTVVVDAALRGDEATVRDLLVPPTAGSVTQWWIDVVEPVRRAIAARTVLARPGEDADSLVASAVLAGLRARVAPMARAHVAGRRIVLLLAAPGEGRPVVLHVLAAAFADRTVDARIVTGPVEQHRLIEITTMTRPAAVVLVSELAAPDLGVVAALAAAHPGVPQFVHVSDDAAADSLPLDRSVHRSRSLTGLLHEVLAVST
jgi:transposase-like protein